MNTEQRSIPEHVARVLERFWRSPLFRQFEAEMRAEADTKREALARERAALIEQATKREAELARARDRAREREAKAAAELDKARGEHLAAEAALSSMDGLPRLLRGVEAELRATCSPSIGEARSRVRELLAKAPELHSYLLEERTEWGRLVWSNSRELDEARREIAALLSELDALELVVAPEETLQATLTKIMERADAATARVPQKPEKGWKDRLTAKLAREHAEDAHAAFDLFAKRKSEEEAAIEANRNRHRDD
jgi:hypothetical protein